MKKQTHDTNQNSLRLFVGRIDSKQGTREDK